MHYLKTYGRKKVLFGTNFPQLSWARCVKQARALDLPAEVESLYFVENARRVFKLA